jgi:choline dehydrogenase
MSSHVDYVVIGAGSAGCAIAARLSEDADARVVVLEAGGPDTLEAIHQPPMWPTLWGTEVDWAYETTPQEANGGLVHQWPRGKVLGGSSSLNGMVYLRGNPADFDDWAYHGCKGWDYEAVLPFFRRMEDVPDGDPHYRGRGGPNTPRPARDPNPICAAFVEAAREKGHPVTDDHNGAQFEGAGYHDLIITDGRRQSAADAYLHPVAARPNLEVVTDAHALGLLFEGDRCAGVRYARDGDVQDLRVAGEVVVCAGAVESPALLLRSGIGPAAELRALGIDAVADVPGVGRNLHDHLLMGVIWEPAHPTTQPVPPPAYNLAESSMLTRSDPALRVPDLHFMCIHVPYHLPVFSVPEGSWTIAVGLVRPASRGTLRLRSADPADTPLIDPAYLREEADVVAMVRGVEIVRDLVTASAFDDWRGAEALPGAGVRGTAALRDFVRSAAGSYFHPVGTCKMGVGPDAVVDPELRVRGIDGLRVADASVMPDVVSVNTNAATMMIGEKAADLLRAARPAAAAAEAAAVGD